MALINCKECGKEISDKATVCPNCGAKNIYNTETASLGTEIICFLLPIVGIIIFAINISSRPKYAKGCLIASFLPLLIVVIVLVTVFIGLSISN